MPPDEKPARTAWHSSLQWRIAIGFIVLMAAVIAVQGAVFLWLLQRSTQVREPGLTRALSAQLARSLEADPAFDIGRFVATVRPGQHVFVIMAGGQVSGTRTPPPRTVEDVIADLDRSGSVPATWENSAYRAAPVVVNGRTVGVLGVVPPTPFEAFGPEMLTLGVLLLVAGAVVASWLILGPVRRRARNQEDAGARRGRGDR
jgi:hypothetical protein